MRYERALVFSLIVGLAGCASTNTAPEVRREARPLPFVGTASFNFMGGMGTAEEITIRPDGTTIVASIPGNTTRRVVSYRGKFVNPIPVGEGLYYRIDGRRISIVDREGRLQKDCANGPCVEELFFE